VNRTYLAAAALVAAAVALAGCSDAHQSAPDPTPGSFVNAPGVTGFKMPPGFRNIIVFCDGPNRVYETSRGDTGSTAEGTTSTLYVIQNDARCTGPR
jgi:hypothetical protein